MATTEQNVRAAAGADASVKVTINGQPVLCAPGQTIVEAARNIGIHIPTLCDEPRLPSVAACRVCMVEVEGAGKMVPGCATKVFDGMVVNTNTERVRQLRHLYLELLLSDHNSFCTPPCQEACPTHIKIPQFLDFIAHGDYKNAVRKLREDLPFPGMLGRMCPRPCEGPCRRQLVEHPITICWLHRFAADQCLEAEQTGELLLPWDPLPESGKRVAIVGAGPAGLAAAFYLRLEGHAVKIFEALPKPGGMMRYGIPNFHMSHQAMDKEMNVVWRLGAELQCGVRLGVDFSLEDLLEKQGFDAVLLALGAFGANEMGIPGENADGVRSASGYLEELERTGQVHTGRRVAVIGGGYTAMDAVRTAVRNGAQEVTCFYRRSRAEMPANLHGVDEAIEEGVKFELYTQPTRVLTDAQGKVVGLEMARMELGEPDASGRRRPVEIEGARYVYDCDQVLVATGQYPLLDGVPLSAGGIAAAKGGVLVADPHTLQTGDPRVFAAGDVVLGAQTVIQAIAQGKKAAWGIDAFLRGEKMAEVSRQLAELKATPFYSALTKRKDLDPRIARMAEIPPVFLDMTTDVSNPSPPAEMPMLDMETRLSTTLEVELGLTESEARRGAELCLDCYCPANGACDLQRYGIEYEVFQNRFHGGAVHDYRADFRHDFIHREPNRCINCNRCVRVCREEVGASCYDAMGHGFDSIVSTPDNLPLQMVGCVSCGKCAETCPTGAIVTNPRVLESYDLDESRCMFCGECVEVCPYDALEQKEYFELAGYDRSKLASQHLFDRHGRPADPLRRTSPELVPHILDAMSGDGLVWEPLGDKPVDLDAVADADDAAPLDSAGGDD
jgi:NADPH-dependent glutamate synthase beta subunit-like oxidoreductase/formate hydrogenlyase subunit 6/NADH:ubiquinone oxidoreductase subunit I/ferredoxin